MAVAHVTEPARRWLDGRAVTVHAALRHGCCGGSAELPVAGVGEPPDQDRFRRVAVDGLDVFEDVRLDELYPGPLTVALDGFGRWRRLVVLEGVHSH